MQGIKESDGGSLGDNEGDGTAVKDEEEMSLKREEMKEDGKQRGQA